MGGDTTSGCVPNDSLHTAVLVGVVIPLGRGVPVGVRDDTLVVDGPIFVVMTIDCVMDEDWNANGRGVQGEWVWSGKAMHRREGRRDNSYTQYMVQLTWLYCN